MFKITIVETETGQVIVDAEAVGYLLAPLDAQGGLLLNGHLPPPAAALASDMIKARFVYPLSDPAAQPQQQPKPQIVKATALPFDPRRMKLGRAQPR